MQLGPGAIPALKEAVLVDEPELSVRAEAALLQLNSRPMLVDLDYDGTDPQSVASINFFLNENMMRMFFGIYMIMVFDPQILFNDG